MVFSSNDNLCKVSYNLLKLLLTSGKITDTEEYEKALNDTIYYDTILLKL